MAVIGAKRLKELLRATAGLNCDKSDVKRLLDLVSDKLYDLLLIGARNASYNGRDLIMEPDLPITKGLQESIREFRALEEEIELQPILDYLASRTRLERPLSVEVEQKLPEIAGGLILVAGRLVKILDPSVVNPDTEMWERVARAMDLTL